MAIVVENSGSVLAVFGGLWGTIKAREQQPFGV